MPFHEHPVFDTPHDETPLWRYTDLPKFISLLSKQSLFFTRADRLGDPFEGSWPRATREAFEVWSKDSEVHMPDETVRSFLWHLRQMTRYVLVNCWVASEHESDAMWKVYGGKTGVAIKTTIGRLKESLRTDREVCIGRVAYTDYERAVIPIDNTFWPYVHKRLAFSHEHEVRAVVIEMPPSLPEGGFDYQVEVCEVGLPVGVDIAHLIQAIAVAPYAAQWFQELVQDVAILYGLNMDVHGSDLSRMPDW